MKVIFVLAMKEWDALIRLANYNESVANLIDEMNRQKMKLRL